MAERAAMAIGSCSGDFPAFSASLCQYSSGSVARVRFLGGPLSSAADTLSTLRDEIFAELTARQGICLVQDLFEKRAPPDKMAGEEREHVAACIFNV
eukprot:CAMPEP_0196573056 /NCGR_PEP_ID=MMETSP1081-20130531/3022_1 /TAXON_ID=36882 /ORGANISM="Pyramimonas amylifera, Strain CCMP720" /LENGTH=96 /DNA_ID=CAMNT_0041890625 /DNA_START=318 /DNA_END=608 /DNA_ORIENTATION=+